MRYGSILRVVFLLTILVFSGCVDRPPQPTVEENAIKKVAPRAYHSFSFNECKPVDKTRMVKKIDNFVIVFDPSASMTETYEASNDCIACHDHYKDSSYAEKHAVKYGGREFAKQDDKLYTSRCNECHQDYLFSKFKFAKKLATCFNKSIPDLELISALRTFGYPVYSMLGNGPEEYDKTAYDLSLRKIFDADGASPLAPTLTAVGKDLFDHPGKKAVIVISDGQDMGQKEVLAAEELKARYGEDICIYTVHIGNDPSGKKTMKKIAIAGQCGVSVSGDDLLAREKMENLVREIFLIKDSDGDGVPDFKDDCPGTLPGLEVDENGCWKLVVLGNVLFDFDKFNIKPEGIIILNQVVNLLNKHNFLDLHISGHTDNFGSMKYNINLSKQRVQSGLNYIQKNGISPKRLSISWHSFSIPVATNDTVEGRALNRRLEFTFKKRQD
ncbi:MAG: OmpA family protein [Desulfobacula sp.]|nr:OmpA family protein [Desulfobacula sp.]